MRGSAYMKVYGVIMNCEEAITRCVCVCVCVCVYVYVSDPMLKSSLIHMYTHIHTHTHIHTYTAARKPRR